MLLLLGWTFSLMRENSRLKEENTRLMKKTGEYKDMKADAKEMLKITPEIKTIKSLREKYGLSIIDAKEIVDSVKE
ncbi:hypothetical protein [Sporosarcina sp. 6E9]|uniref:hypothetical protein n=1 Tax=Sporosarcina sp. 6E9 TaxID=2819235 RepID=UPI001B306B6F|nr:hypothetical protein [Sporosarcina sp. 6E9]